jgi:hypothetical protein
MARVAGEAALMTTRSPMASLNCAGQDCQERDGCRRFVVRVNVPDCSRENPYGAWASFDLERRAFGDCKQFVKYRAA